MWGVVFKVKHSYNRTWTRSERLETSTERRRRYGGPVVAYKHPTPNRDLSQARRLALAGLLFVGQSRWFVLHLSIPQRRAPYRDSAACHRF